MFSLFLLIKTPNTSTKYEYDILGRLSKVTDKNNLVTKYTYDNIGNLIKEVVTENGKVTLTASYSYDAVGNRLTKTENNITTNYTYDKNNRLLKEGNISYTYDNAGNLINSTGTTKNTYLFAGEEKDNTTGYYYLRAR